MYKAWSADRNVKKLVEATSLKEFIHNGCKKLGYEHDNVRVVLESDGTLVEDNDYFLTLPEMCRFILLNEDEMWSAASHKTGDCNLDHTDAGIDTTSNEIQNLLQMLKNDITKIVTFSREQLQALVDLDPARLAVFLEVSAKEGVHIHVSCQRYLDELQESKEALELLHIIADTKHDPSRSQEDTPIKRQKTS